MTPSLSAEYFTAESTEINLASLLTAENEWLFSISEVHTAIDQPMVLGNHGAHEY